MSSLDGQCNGKNGICIHTSTCSNYGGQTSSGNCPTDPSDVKCCDNIPCSANGKSGKCLFRSQCSGEIADGLCPGGVILYAVLMENHHKILHLMDLAVQVVALVLILKELVAKQV